MPRVNGFDWSTLADEIRDGSVTLNQQQRFTICKNLTRLIELLENSRCCHRDLSCGNIFIDTNTWQVYLIDWDSFYHPSLQMPRATTCGTAGYTAHLVWDNGNLDPRGTWCEHADRYALSLLNVELLLVSQARRLKKVVFLIRTN
jgi:serine/threonine protein kinase